MECGWCGGHHGRLCPSVKAIEFHPTGEVKRVEFVTGADYPPLETRWPHSASNMAGGVATLSRSKAPT
jgi:hypothetical protein